MPQPSPGEGVRRSTVQRRTAAFTTDSAIIFDDEDRFDDFTMHPGSAAPSATKSIPGNTLSKNTRPDRTVPVLTLRTIYLNAATNQLVVYDGDQLDSAMVDNVFAVR
jgi:hypothetical protein